MTTHSEIETLILINRQDSKEGFFTFSTTNQNDYKRLVRRIGGEKELLSLDVSRSRGKVVQWIARVPIRFYSLRAFSVRPASRVARSDAVGSSTERKRPQRGQSFTASGSSTAD